MLRGKKSQKGKKLKWQAAMVGPFYLQLCQGARLRGGVNYEQVDVFRSGLLSNIT